MRLRALRREFRLVFEIEVDLHEQAAERKQEEGRYAIECMRAADRAIRRYRDEELRVRRTRAELMERETWAHWLWRHRKPWKPARLPKLLTPDKAPQLVDKWPRLAPDVEGKRYTLSDPRRRSIDDFIAGEQAEIKGPISDAGPSESS